MQKENNFAVEMRVFDSPLVWLARVRKRCGYGVHSPFAFRFITEVIYERSAYYAYAPLRRQLRWWQRCRVEKICRLVLRIANRQHPRVVLVSQGGEVAIPYIICGCRRAEVLSVADGRPVDLCYLTGPDEAALQALSPQAVLIVDRLQRNKAWFRSLPYTVAFDLHDVGIAFFGLKLNRQYYRVNFE